MDTDLHAQISALFEHGGSSGVKCAASSLMFALEADGTIADVITAEMKRITPTLTTDEALDLVDEWEARGWRVVPIGMDNIVDALLAAYPPPEEP